MMAEVTGAKELAASIRKRALAAGDKDVTGTVGFTQAYGIYVHENLEAHHPVGNAKFLENPLREGREEMQRIITTSLRNGQTLKQAITLACLWLQRQSMQQCPVDTGALRASAFTRVE